MLKGSRKTGSMMISQRVSDFLDRHPRSVRQHRLGFAKPASASELPDCGPDLRFKQMAQPGGTNGTTTGNFGDSAR